MPKQGVVVVTGASSGIGLASTKSLLESGYEVIGCALDDSAGEEMMRLASDSFIPILLDITKAESVEELSKRVAEVCGSRGLDGLVNNAGVGAGGPLELMPLGEVRRVFEINLFAHVAVTQALLPHVRRGKGRIVFMSSMLGLCATPHASAYAATKFALEAIADCLRVELRPWRIGVSLVEPAFVRTPIVEKAFAYVDRFIESLSPDQLALYERDFTVTRKRLPSIERWSIPPERVANAVVHALDSSWPKTRYRVGVQSHVLAGLRWLPTRWRDAMVAAAIR